MCNIHFIHLVKIFYMFRNKYQVKKCLDACSIIQVRKSQKADPSDFFSLTIHTTLARQYIIKLTLKTMDC